MSDAEALTHDQVEAIRTLAVEIELGGHHSAADPECQNRVCRALYTLRSEVIGPHDLAHEPVSENGSKHSGG